MKPIGAISAHKVLRRALLIAPTLMLAIAAGAQAPSGGGVPPSPAMQAKFQAWRQWRDNHKNVMSLQRTLGALAQMEQDPRTKLTKPQAKAVLAVIHKWQGKSALTDSQARQVNTQITTPLTLAQIKKVATAAQERRGGFGGGRPGGGGAGAGGRPGFDPASIPAPRDYNPLNPATQPMPRARERAKQRMAQLMAALTAS